MSRYVFAVDLDGVCYGFFDGLKQYAWNRHGIRLEDPVQYHLARLSDRDDINEDLLSKIDDERFYAEYVRPYPWAAQALAQLREHGTMAFITARPTNLHNHTRRSLMVDFGPDVMRGASLNMTKYKIRTARTAHATHAFEDSPSYVEQYAAARIPVYMMRSSYMGNVRPSWYVRPETNLLTAAQAFVRDVVIGSAPAYSEPSYG